MLNKFLLKALVHSEVTDQVALVYETITFRSRHESIALQYNVEMVDCVETRTR